MGFSNKDAKTAKEIQAAKKSKLHIFNKHDRVKYNRSSFVVVKDGDTYAKIAKEFKVNVGSLLYYNNYTGKDELYEGGIVFIEPKRTKAKVKQHVVAEGETMKSISELYGIDLKSLYEKNWMKPRDPQPKTGTVLYLRKNKPAK